MTFLYFLLVLSIVLASLKSSLFNLFGKQVLKNNADIYIFNVLSYLGAILVLCAVNLAGGFTFKISPFSVLIAFFYGFSIVMMQILSIKAMSTGPMALSSLFVMYGLVIPTVAGTIFWHEPVSRLQIAAMAMLLVSCFLSSNPKKEKGITVKWLVFASLSFVFSGLVGVAEKVHQTSAYKDELSSFLIAGFLFMLVMSLIAYFYRAGAKKEKLSFPVFGSRALGALSVGLVMGCYNKVNLFLSGNLSSIIYFPVSSGGAIILTSLIAVLFFKEKMSKNQLLGILIGIVSVCILGIG